MNSLRNSLEEVVAAIPLEHPHYPASYAAADASITGGNGLDWKAVSRGDGDTVSSLPRSALNCPLKSVGTEASVCGQSR